MGFGAFGVRGSGFGVLYRGLVDVVNSAKLPSSSSSVLSRGEVTGADKEPVISRIPVTALVPLFIPRVHPLVPLF